MAGIARMAVCQAQGGQARALPERAVASPHGRVCPMSLAFELVMFDLDGTLIATAPEICDAVNDTLRHFGLQEVTQDQVDGWIGHGTRELLIQAVALREQAAPQMLRASRHFAEMNAAFDRHYLDRCGTRSEVYPRVWETLATLRQRGVKIAVVTNKENRYTQTVLDAHQITPLVDLIVSGDTLPTKKPDPAGVMHCLRKFCIEPDRALFVGDSSIDVATARNAGVRVWALPYGYNMGKSIQASHPDRVIADCSALIA
jgi:phosphoglycolate phosphatase